MSGHRRLLAGSVAFAVLWTLLMIWWTGTETANVFILAISGAVVGLLWYFAMRWWMGRLERRPDSRP